MKVTVIIDFEDGNTFSRVRRPWGDNPVFHANNLTEALDRVHDDVVAGAEKLYGPVKSNGFLYSDGETK